MHLGDCERILMHLVETHASTFNNSSCYKLQQYNNINNSNKKNEIVSEF